MNVNVSLDGHIEKIVNNAINKGIVKTKAEAIRQGILQLGEKYNLVDNTKEDVSLEEVLLVNKKIAKEMERINKDKIKGISLEELKKKYGYN